MAQVLAFLLSLALLYSTASTQSLTGKWVGTYVTDTSADMATALSFDGATMLAYSGDIGMIAATYTITQNTGVHVMTYSPNGDGPYYASFTFSNNDSLSLLLTDNGDTAPTTVDLTDASCTDNTCSLFTLTRQDPTMNTQLLGVWLGTQGNTQAGIQFTSPNVFRDLRYDEGDNTRITFTKSDVVPEWISFAYPEDVTDSGNVRFGLYEIDSNNTGSLSIVLNSIGEITRPDAFPPTNCAACESSTLMKQDSTPDAGLIGVWAGYAVDDANDDTLDARIWTFAQGSLSDLGTVGNWYTLQQSGSPNWLSYSLDSDGQDGTSYYFNFGLYKFDQADSDTLHWTTNADGEPTRLTLLNDTCTGCSQQYLLRQVDTLPVEHELNGRWKSQADGEEITFKFTTGNGVSTAIRTILDGNGGQTDNFNFYIGKDNSDQITFVSPDNGEVRLGIYKITDTTLNLAYNEDGNGKRPTSFNQANCDTCTFYTLTYVEPESTDHNSANQLLSSGISFASFISLWITGILIML